MQGQDALETQRLAVLASLGGKRAWSRCQPLVVAHTSDLELRGSMACRSDSVTGSSAHRVTNSIEQTFRDYRRHVVRLAVYRDCCCGLELIDGSGVPGGVRVRPHVWLASLGQTLTRLKPERVVQGIARAWGAAASAVTIPQ